MDYFTCADEDFENRRSKFIYRIGYIEQSIESLEATKQQIPAQQLLLAQKMSQTETRMFELNEEIERVVSYQGNTQFSSHLLHGASQVRIAEDFMVHILFQQS